MLPKPEKTESHWVWKILIVWLLLCIPFCLRADVPVSTTAAMPGVPDAVEQIATLEPLLPTDSPEPQEDIPVETPPPEANIVFSDSTLAAQAPTQQPTPTPTAAPDHWQYETDTLRVDIRRYRQDDFVYFAADIQLTDVSQFSYAFSGEQYGAQDESLSDMASRHDPVIAINGDYYGFHNNGIIIRGGELFRRNKSSRHLLAVEANGDLTVLTDRREKQWTVAEGLLARNVLHTFEFGPVLVENGKAVTLQSAIVRVGNGYLEPRTAIGQYGPLHYLVLVVDGRSEGYSAGCDLPTLQSLFVQHGVQTAFNLDGGGSTTLWFNGNVINEPASGGERRVSDIIMFMP